MTHLRSALGLVLCGTALLASCRSPDRSAENGTTAQVVDSVVPWDTALARFRDGMAEPDSLTGGAASLEGLIERFVTLLERADTAALATLMLTRAEFAYLYYPWVPEARPPYDLRPGLMWFMIEGDSQKGLGTALEERGGRPLEYVGYRCAEPTRRMGENTLYPLCLVRRLQTAGDTVEERMFGPIVERDGRFKFVSLANKLS